VSIILSLYCLCHSPVKRLAVAPVKHWSLHTLRERARETIPDTLKKIEDTRGARRGRALRSLTLCRVLSKLPVSGSPAARRSPTLRVRLCATVRALYLRYTRDQSVLYHQHHASHHRHRAYSILRAGRRRFRYGYNVSPLSVSCYRPQCESEYPNQLTLLTYSTYLDH